MAVETGNCGKNGLQVVGAGTEAAYDALRDEMKRLQGLMTVFDEEPSTSKAAALAEVAERLAWVAKVLRARTELPI